MSSRSVPSVLSGSQPVDPTAKPHKASFETTAALAQKEASTPNEARIVNRNASEERDAAEKAAEVAREHGEDFTGKPEGDTNVEAVRESLTHLRGGVKFDQVYGSGDSQGSQPMSGKACGAEKGPSSKSMGGGQGAAQSARGTAETAYSSSASAASSTAKSASNKASEAFDSASESTSRAAGAASQKASEAYRSGKPTVPSDRGWQAVGGAPEAGGGILGTMQHTAASAMHTAQDTASSVFSAAQQFVGMGTSGQDESAVEGVAQKGGVQKKRVGGGVPTADTTPSVRN